MRSVEGGALVVERERLAGVLHLVGEPVVTERDRPDRPVDRDTELLDRYAERLDRVEQSEEFDLDLLAAVHGLADAGIRAMPENEIIEIDQHVANPAHDPDCRQAAIADRLLAVLPPGGHRVALHLRMRHGDLVDHRRHQPLACDQGCQRARGEGAAAEAEDVDLVAFAPVPAQEAIELADVGRHADAGGAVEGGERRPAGGADTLDVIGDLIGLGMVERLVKTPDAGFLGAEGVAGAVGEQHQLARRPRVGCIRRGCWIILRMVRPCSTAMQRPVLVRHGLLRKFSWRCFKPCPSGILQIQSVVSS